MVVAISEALRSAGHVVRPPLQLSRSGSQALASDPAPQLPGQETPQTVGAVRRIPGTSASQSVALCQIDPPAWDRPPIEHFGDQQDSGTLGERAAPTG